MRNTLTPTVRNTLLEYYGQLLVETMSQDPGGNGARKSTRPRVMDNLVRWQQYNLFFIPASTVGRTRPVTDCHNDSSPQSKHMARRKRRPHPAQFHGTPRNWIHPRGGRTLAREMVPRAVPRTVPKKTSKNHGKTGSWSVSKICSAVRFLPNGINTVAILSRAATGFGVVGSFQ